MEQTTVMPTTKEDFWKLYWFTPYQLVTLINPKSYDYKFMVEMRNFVVKAGTKEKLPGTVANVYLSQMTRIMAQDDDKTSFLSDFALMKQYYDKLIVGVDSLVSEVDSTPAYLQQVPESARGEAAPELPPWQTPEPSAIPETNSEMKNTYNPEKVIAKVPAKPSEKEFDLNGQKFKMTIDKNDKETYFRDGTRISAADYNKAASML